MIRMELLERCRIFQHEKQVLDSDCSGLNQGNLVDLIKYPTAHNDLQNGPLTKENIRIFKDNIKKDFHLMLSQYSREEIEEAFWAFIY